MLVLLMPCYIHKAINCTSFKRGDALTFFIERIHPLSPVAVLLTFISHCYGRRMPCSFFLSIFYLFFPRLISAVGDWMFAILPHMAWP